MDTVMVSSTGCLKLCEKGPVVLVYPEGYWYQGVEGEDAIDAILDGLRPAQVALSVPRFRIEPESVGAYGGYQAIWIDPVTGVYSGATEKRKDGCAAGY